MNSNIRSDHISCEISEMAFGIHDDRLTATIIVNAGNAGTRSLFGKLNSRSGKVHSPRLWQNGDDLLDLAVGMWLGFWVVFSGMLLLVWRLAAGFLAFCCWHVAWVLGGIFWHVAGWFRQ
ncbi:hypothetical protein WN944_023425 [Citrus x changshan-huyou]|uniref:Uncharacterized protein n=1 Tax=Citrus x changshan-huyou TaxID=2935761 RepID=A0AAP0N050_9ROSI